MKVICARCRCSVEDEGHGLHQCCENLDRRFEVLREATLTSYIGQIRWLLDTPQPFEDLVHILVGGWPLCGFDYPTAAGGWPKGHTWVREEDAKDATCILCLNARGGS